MRSDSAHGFEGPTHNKDNNNSDSSDDVWADDSDDVPDPSETTRLSRDHYNAGYLEGITKSKEGALQEGFDSGYPLGAQIGLQAGNILGKLQGLGLSELEKQAKDDLSAESLFNERYWDHNVNKTWQGEIHPLIKRWQIKLEGVFK